jgi:hypothetical protein
MRYALLPDGYAGSHSSQASEHDDISPDDQSVPNSDVSQQAKDVLSLVNAEQEKIHND